MRLGWVLGAALLAACGDNIVMRYDEFPAVYGEAWCRFQLRCGLLASAAECAKFYSWQLSPDLVGAVQTGVTTFDPEAAHECAEWVDRLSCDPTTATWREPTCFAYFVGTRHDGEPCTFGDECISRECWLEGATCNDACCSGYCTGNEAPAPGHIGDRCRYAPCAEGYCDGNVCQPLVGKDGACVATRQCAIGLSCWDGRCEALPGAGEPCVGACRSVGEICNGLTGVCEHVRTLGEQCYAQSFCSPFYRCTATTTERCEELALGESCSYADVCPNPFVCDPRTFTCVVPKPDGEACLLSRECASGICRAGVCAPAPEPCY